MISLLKEYISYLIQEQLEEDKFADAVKQYPDFKSEIDIAQNEGIKPKYLPWLIKQYKIAYDNFTLIPVIKKFDELVSNNIIKGKESDINQYKYYRDLRAFVNKASVPSGAELKKQAKSNSKKIYENEDFLIIEPLSKEASMYYGKGTKWCISGLVDNKFDDYFTTKTGTADEDVLAGVWFLFNKKENTKYAITFSDPGAPMIGSTTIYNAEDDRVNPWWLSETLPENIMKLINQKAGFTFLSKDN